MEYKKLILFDIDGTLIRHVGESLFSERLRYGAKRAYGIEVSDTDVLNFRGSVDKDTAWSIIHSSGISYDFFESKFDEFSRAMYDFLVKYSKNTVLYQKIDDAEKLARTLRDTPGVALGLLTGNVKTIGIWKLEHAKLGDIFTFGIFGDTANDRFELAKMVPHEAQIFFHHSFRPDETYVLGDTIYDVRCAKSIGAHCVAVTTGHHGSREELVKEEPDLVVDSLLDEKVLKLLF